MSTDPKLVTEAGLKAAALTDAELSALVAERVANKLECDQWKPFNSQSMIKGDCGHTDCIPKGMKINYATSADAVLPLLEKHTKDTGGHGEPEVFRFHSPADETDTWTCEIIYLHHDGQILILSVAAPTMPRCACLALLAAHADTQASDRKETQFPNEAKD